MPHRGASRSLVLRILLALPAVAAAVAFYLSLTLPNVSVLRMSNPTTTAFTERRAAEARARGENDRAIARHRLTAWASYDRISPHLKRAVILAEDGAFWQHDGLDYTQIKESVEVNLERREFARGASTVTQQLAKNLYLSPSKNPIRKLEELMIARRLEAQLSKRRILELYLNVIEWGDGIYGAEAASRAYFQRPASTLTADQSALLAAAIINPRILNPARPSARLTRRKQLVLGRMGEVEPPPIVETAAELDATPTIPIAGLPPVFGQPVPLEAPPPRRPQ
ncbi:MAG: monofunctional biosynthetic peptidoglycan transglycosylase [Acidobacteria bacterium]|nr:monofunctional biosynthetic peptidoglycan transglycosylase [Acidobacteriota bacterium]